MLTIAQVRDDLLSKLGIEDYTAAPPLGMQDVVIAINGAMQMLQAAGQDFFTRQYTSVTLVAGSTFYTLPGSVQAVLGPIRWGTKPLRALGSRGELDQYTRIFGGGSAYGVGTAAEPEAYWVENVRNQSSQGEINQINIWIAPVPTPTPGSLQVEVVNDAVAYAVGDLVPGTAVLPVAQNYTESIFLPLARMLITRSYLFSRPDILEGITNDYNNAMATLAAKGGFPNAVQPAPPREVDA